MPVVGPIALFIVVDTLNSFIAAPSREVTIGATAVGSVGFGLQR
ncbi:hypothetical protein CES85_5428 [Ochrobactrum quorumnocens]|uniref:Uncharacterized protein n=1 Tax=Ochrobactrum quorumnocens TaxID=271865 RepID=A0A248UCT9_9HYPH|nr:hypothetical protein CES85_5428 [[Ochrobactrum] quorumnocens]